jgi:hypothetical protein
MYVSIDYVTIGLCHVSCTVYIQIETIVGCHKFVTALNPHDSVTTNIYIHHSSQYIIIHISQIYI